MCITLFDNPFERTKNQEINQIIMVFRGVKDVEVAVRKLAFGVQIESILLKSLNIS